jgi:hypothetical protein
MKKFVVTALALSLSFGAFAGAEAEAKRKRVAEGIIIGIGIAALVGAASAAAQEGAGNPSYAYDDDYDPRENAVAACLHRANRVVRQNGGDGIELRRVLRVGRIGSSSWRVDLQALGYYDDDVDRHSISCRVFQGRVTKFGMS